MGIGVEVEEWAGEIWHKFITRRADPGFPEAQVELEDMQRSLAVLLNSASRRQQPTVSGRLGGCRKLTPTRQLSGVP